MRSLSYLMSPTHLFREYGAVLLRFCVRCRTNVQPVLDYCVFCGDLSVGHFDVYPNEFEVPMRQGVWQLAPDPAAHTHPRAARRRTIHVAHSASRTVVWAHHALLF